MNKNEQTATMYENIPAVAELNKVPGFNPLKLLRRIISPENGEEMMQLDLRYKKLWFRLANPKGRIRLNALRITEQMAIYEAQVFLERTDENPIGSFTSSCTKEEAPGGQYIQAAQYAAMDEALSDAGFGIQFADVGMDAKGSRYGSRIPFNGTSQKKETTALTGTAAVSTERKQPDTASARSTVTAFPAAAEKKEIPQQENPAQASGLPIQGAKAAVNAAASLPAGSQGGSECLPAGPGKSFGTLPVQSGAAQEPSGQPSAGAVQTMEASGENKTEPSARIQEPAENSSLPVGLQATKVQGTAQPAGTGEQPVRAGEPESLPVQKNAEMPAAGETGNNLPVSERKDMEGDTGKAVQDVMALLSGQNVPTEAAVSAGGNTASAENAEGRGPEPEVLGLPVSGETVQEKADARYTPDMPVEEIVKLMTFEEAGKVVVDTGVCKGQTIAEVAERRPPSLKFYLYGGYRGDNNILRAAARIMLDSLAAKKAG
ncbi:hypothetical protein [Faecalibaculum rodentium]|uniref:hypothetical protein n=1 Tax=Faecalibaculum rodentium TaxID=1702221 RepID=UPI0025A2131B|nr:hypothetical protein [Faecalibaculum rodentium]